MHDAPIWFHHLLTAGIISAGVRLAWVDLKKLEIELETLGLMLVMAFLQSWLFVDTFETVLRLFVGLAFWLILWFGNAHLPRLHKFGAGDPPLIGVITFLITPMVMQWALIATVLMLGTSAWYSMRRGKKMFKSIFPAAPPLLMAAMVLYLSQWA